jgi:hypothetical protein
MSNEHENVIHAMADKLLDFFEGSGAVNYIEQTFGCNDDPSKSFVVTMQKVDGLTPCQKLVDAERRVEELENALTEIAKLPEVRQDEGQYIACRALGVS